MSTNSSDYSEYTDFASDDWNGWEASVIKHQLAIAEEGLERYAKFEYATNKLVPVSNCRFLPLIQKTIEGLIAGKVYTISLRVKYGDADRAKAQLSWNIDNHLYLQADLQAENEWQNFVVDFRATKPQHVLTLGSVEPECAPVDIAFDDIRIYPHVVEIDFEAEKDNNLARPGEHVKLQHFILHNQGGKNASKTGVEKTEVSVKGMAAGKGVVLADSQSTDNQRASLELHGEYGYIEFAWTQVHYDCKVEFYEDNKALAKPLHTMSVTGNGTPTHFWIKYRAEEDKLVRKIVFHTTDNSFIDYMTLKSAAVLTSRDKTEEPKPESSQSTRG